MRRVLRCLAATALIAVLGPAFSGGGVLAADAVVSAPCSESDFDDALATAQTGGGGTITFACGGVATIDFSSVKTISAPNSVVIDGAGVITLDGGGTTRLFEVESGAALEVRNITLSNGYASNSAGAIRNDGVLTVVESTLRNNVADASASGGNVAIGGLSGGGAILNDTGATATISDSTFENNQADSSAFISGPIFAVGGTAAGGAISNLGALTISGSTFHGNVANATASGNGGGGTLTGGIATGGAISSAGAGLTITNSTFSDNHADASKTALAGGGTTLGGAASGGAIHHLFGTMSISSSTVTLNTAGTSGSGANNNFGGATGGGGLHRTIGSTLDTGQTIVVENLPEDCTRSLNSNDYNLDSDGSCELSGPNDISDGDAGLAPLTDNGGPTMTHAPSASADAFDTGPATCIATDQRGLPRPAADACDIGSVELQSSTYPLCVARYTGRVLSPLNGQCMSGQTELLVPQDLPLAFCISNYTGIVNYTSGLACNDQHHAHVVPDDGDLLTCVNTYNGINRAVMNHGQCTGIDVPNTIPAV